MKNKNMFPVGISTLSKMVETCYYVDKTQFVEKLVKDGQYYFLSRPRRFGKSLLLDTIKQAFLGNKDVFKGLYLENNWDWDKKYPVIHLSFGSSSVLTEPEILNNYINTILLLNARNHELELYGDNYSNNFHILIDDIYKKNGNTPVVILIDEYDKPILETLTNPELCKQMRDVLRGLYGVIKDNDDKIKFTFLTGVSKFSKAGIFSQLNNLRDITYNTEYGAVCGYTQEELETTFGELIVAEDLPDIKRWYNGYNFMSDVSVYNPFSILNFFADRKTYNNYWFSSGSPSFLINLLFARKYYLPDLEKTVVPKVYLDAFDIEKIDINLLLFQSGYLTISHVNTEDKEQYMVEFSVPNKEVEISLNAYIIKYIYGDIATTYSLGNNLNQALIKGDFVQVKDAIINLFAGVPYNWYVKNDIAHYEGFYCSLFYAFLIGQGHNIVAEDTTNKGRIDITLIYKNIAYIFELKTMLKASNIEPLQQIKDRQYAQKYIGKYDKVYAIGMIFNEVERNLVDFAWELC